MFKDLDGFIEPGSEEERLVAEIDLDRLPAHIAVIMDGNGRWAAERNLPRIEGHRAAIKAVQEVVETSARLGVRVLTLYAFSKENWKRPKSEVSTLFRVLEKYLRKEDKVLVENDLRLRLLGQREGLPASVRKQIDRVEALVTTIVVLVHDPTGQTARARPASTWATTGWPRSESGRSIVVPTATPSIIQ